MTATERRYEELRAVAAARRAIGEAKRKAERRAWWLSGVWMGVVLGWVLALAWVLGLAAGRFGRIHGWTRMDTDGGRGRWWWHRSEGTARCRQRALWTGLRSISAQEGIAGRCRSARNRSRCAAGRRMDGTCIASGVMSLLRLDGCRWKRP